MKAIDSISNTDKVNYLNIGLLGISTLVAFFVPFELFLFSYAVLGPLHYLTEISWLHERKYFTKGKYDFVFLGLAGLILFLLLYVTPRFKVFEPINNAPLSTAMVYVAFVAALGMVFLKTAFQRFIAFIIICASAVIVKNQSIVLLFSVFLPTLIHVYLFTGLFMLYGALKGRSKSGYTACVIFLICPLLLIFINPASTPVSSYALETYPMFQAVNVNLMALFDENVFSQFKTMEEGIYYSEAGLIAMRFIAFAYTYHYLNWFSKTSLIGWHKVPKLRLAIIGVLWITAVALYWYNYRIGFHALFLLSFLHVFLEFPLNHVTFVGIFKELAGGASGGKKATVAVKGKKK